MRNLIRALPVCLVVLLVACASREPGPLPPPEGDLAYLLDADPAAVTTGQLLNRARLSDEHMMKHSVVEGVWWQAIRSSPAVDAPDQYGSGGDSLLYTGIYLSGCAYRFGETRSTEDLDKAIEALRGVYILSHVSGTPGSLMRCAFPTDKSELFNYPSHWQSRINKGFVYDSPTDVADPFNPGEALPQMTFYTRVTRDQVTGLVYGLATFWHVVTPDKATNPADRAKIERARQILAETVNDVYWHLRKHDFDIRDQTGRNDTSADHVKEDLLRLSLLAIYRKTVHLVADQDRVDRIQKKYDDLFWNIKSLGFFLSDPFNRFSNASQYYAWNLRFTRSMTVWMLEDEEGRKAVSEYVNCWMWRHTKNHLNAWFSVIYAAMSGDQKASDSGVLALKSWSLRPLKGWPSPLAEGWGREYDGPSGVSRFLGLADDDVLWPHLRKATLYWTWQKEPWDRGYTYPEARFDMATLDFSVPYWMARYYDLIK